MQQLYVVDGSGFLFRAYHGMPPLTNDEGQSVHAVFGVAKMMIKILMDKPDYFVIARDAPQKTIRHTQYEDYKAGRPPAPDDLKRQIGQTKELISQLHIPSLESPGYEADDLINTMVKTYQARPDIQITIITSDKDMKQLITDNVVCFDPMKNLRMTYSDFLRDYEYQPLSIVDYLALVGDSSDNIAWVAGIGHKTAETLIKKYHTIDKIYDHIDEISGSVKEKLVNGKDAAYHSRDLIRLMDVPEMSHIPLEQYKRPVDYDLLKERLVHGRGFHSIEKKIDELKKKYEKPVQMWLF